MRALVGTRLCTLPRAVPRQQDPPHMNILADSLKITRYWAPVRRRGDESARLDQLSTGHRHLFGAPPSSAPWWLGSFRPLHVRSKPYRLSRTDPPQSLSGACVQSSAGVDQLYFRVYPAANRLDGSIRLDRPVNSSLGHVKAWGVGSAARVGRIFHPDLLADVHPGPLGSDGFGRVASAGRLFRTDFDLV